MIEPAEWRQRLAPHLDPEVHIRRLKGAIRCRSVTGEEANFVDFLQGQLMEIGLQSERADFLPGRPNIWALRAGAGGGPTLLVMGHTDTVHVRGWREHWSGTDREDPFSAAEADGAIWGRGSADLKAGICAAIGALELLERAGKRLCGDVLFAFVGDEESGEPGTGTSAGARDLVGRMVAGEIARPDFAIYTEPTRLSVFTAQMGFFIAEVRITGKSAYFGLPEEGVDALKAGHGALSAIWRHSEEIARAGSHPLIGRSFALVTEFRSGGSIAVPGDCRFSVIRKLRPGESLDEAAVEFECAVRSSVEGIDGASVEIGFPAGRDHPLGGTPAEIEPGMPAVAVLGAALQAAAPGAGAIEGAPYWSESAFLVNQMNCPAVYCGPGDIAHCHTVMERVEVDEYLAGIMAFAVFFASYCGVAGE